MAIESRKIVQFLKIPKDGRLVDGWRVVGDHLELRIENGKISIELNSERNPTNPLCVSYFPTVPAKPSDVMKYYLDNYGNLLSDSNSSRSVMNARMANYREMLSQHLEALCSAIGQPIERE